VTDDEIRRPRCAGAEPDDLRALEPCVVCGADVDINEVPAPPLQLTDQTAMVRFHLVMCADCAKNLPRICAPGVSCDCLPSAHADGVRCDRWRFGFTLLVHRDGVDLSID